MNTLPLDCLVANFLAHECRPDTLEEQGGVYSIVIDDTHWLGVQISESEDSLLFFAHPGPRVKFRESPQDDEDSSEHSSEELQVGEDTDGRWILIADRYSGRYTLSIRVEHQLVGHAEYGRIVSNFRWRFVFAQLRTW